MSNASGAPDQRKAFEGGSPAAARAAASKWLRDFSAHGPLDIHGIRVSEDGERFLATVVYSHAEVETTPRHFPDQEPLPLRKSA